MRVVEDDTKAADAVPVWKIDDFLFELDSILIVMQMSGRWGCHRRHLRDLLAECYDLGEQLTQSGCAWSIRHIYREFNQVADKLAGDCLSNAANARASPSW